MKTVTTTSPRQELMQECVSLHLNGQLDAAEIKYREAIADDSTSYVLHNNLGFLLAQRGRYPEAITFYQTALNINPEYATAYNNLGQTYLLMKQWNLAIECLMKALSLDNQNYQACESLANFHLTQQHWSEAEQYWRHCITLDPKSSTLLTLAHCQIMQGKTDEAESVLEAAADAEKNNAVLYGLLGNIHFARNDFGSAIKYFKFSLGLAPDDTEVRHNLALTYLKTDQAEEAMKEFSFMLQFDPTNEELRNNVGVLELSLGQDEKASKLFEATLNTSPTNPKALYYMSIIMLKNKKIEEAIAFANRTIATGVDEYVIHAQQLLEGVNKHREVVDMNNV